MDAETPRTVSPNDSKQFSTLAVTKAPLLKKLKRGGGDLFLRVYTWASQQSRKPVRLQTAGEKFVK